MLFADVKLQAGDSARQLQSLGLKIHASKSAAGPPCFNQPCPAWAGSSCHIYAERPEDRRKFDCLLLKALKEGETAAARAVRVVRNARKLAAKVERLLAQLGDEDISSALAARFRRTAWKMETAAPDPKTTALYGKLTLAFHELNVLLSTRFYPGDAV